LVNQEERAMKLKKRDIGGVAIVDIEGTLVGGPENSETFHSLFRSLLEEGYRNIAVNLQRTRWANSQGIGMLMGANTSVKSAGGELVLAHVADRIHGILTVTKLYLIFPTLETEKEVLEYFGGKTALTGS